MKTKKAYLIACNSLVSRSDVDMGQAKTLTERELKRVLDYVALHRHAARNRAMVMLTVRVHGVPGAGRCAGPKPGCSFT